MRIACLICFAVSFPLLAQRYAVVDMESVLQRMPDYLQVNAQVEKLSRGWEAELRRKEVAVQKKKDEFVANAPFFTEDIRKNKEEELRKMEAEIGQLNRRYFGFEGLYFKKKRELLKPLQDRVYEVIERLAQDRHLDMIIDRSAAGSLILYVEPKLDLTGRVLQRLRLQ